MKTVICGLNINLMLFSIIFGHLKIIQNLGDMIYTCICLNSPNTHISQYAFSIVLIIFIIPCAVALIFGAIQNKRYLILIWLICSIMDMLSILRFFDNPLLTDAILRTVEISKN